MARAPGLSAALRQESTSSGRQGANGERSPGSGAPERSPSAASTSVTGTPNPLNLALLEAVEQLLLPGAVGLWPALLDALLAGDCIDTTTPNTSKDVLRWGRQRLGDGSMEGQRP